MTGSSDPNLFPKRRMRHFTSGLASRLFLNPNQQPPGNNLSSTTSLPQPPSDTQPLSQSRGAGLRRDRQGNVVGNGLNHHKTTASTNHSSNANVFPQTPQQTGKKPLRLPQHLLFDKQRSNSPFAGASSSSRKSNRTDRTEPDNSLSSTTPSPSRNHTGPGEGHLAGDHTWAASQQQQQKSRTRPTTPNALRRGLSETSASVTPKRSQPVTPTRPPLVESMDKDGAPAFPMFPATSPKTPRKAYEVASPAAGSTRSRTPKRESLTPRKKSSIPHTPLGDDTTTDESSSPEVIRASPTEPLQFRASPPADRHVKPEPARVSSLQPKVNRAIAKAQQGEETSALSKTMEQGMGFLFEPMKKMVQCAQPEHALEGDPALSLNDPIPMERALSNVSAASTQVATNRATDITKRRIREMEQHIQTQYNEAAKQQKDLKAQRDLKQQLDQVEIDSLPTDEEVDLKKAIRLQRSPVREKGRQSGRNGEVEEDGKVDHSSQNDHQPPKVIHTPVVQGVDVRPPVNTQHQRLSFGATNIPARRLEQHSILSMSDDESSRMTQSTVPSQQGVPGAASTPVHMPIPTSIHHRRRKKQVQVDMVPAEDHTNHQRPASSLSRPSYGEVSHDPSRSSSVGVEVNGTSSSTKHHFHHHYPSAGGNVGLKSLSSEPLQPLIEAQQETSPKSGSNNHVSDDPQKPDNLMLPNLQSPGRGFAKTAAAIPKTPDGRPNLNGTNAKSPAAKNSVGPRTPKSEGRASPRVTQTRPLTGGLYLSPPGVTGRIPQVREYSPDPIFCSKSITSSDMNRSMMSGSTWSPSTAGGTNNSQSTLGLNLSFDSSIRSRMSHGTVPSLQAVPEGVTVGGAGDSSSGDENGSEQAVLGPPRLKVSPGSSFTPTEVVAQNSKSDGTPSERPQQFVANRQSFSAATGPATPKKWSGIGRRLVPPPPPPPPPPLPMQAPADKVATGRTIDPNRFRSAAHNQLEQPVPLPSNQGPYNAGRLDHSAGPEQRRGQSGPNFRSLPSWAKKENTVNQEAEKFCPSPPANKACLPTPNEAKPPIVTRRTSSVLAAISMFEKKQNSNESNVFTNTTPRRSPDGMPPRSSPNTMRASPSNISPRRSPKLVPLIRKSSGSSFFEEMDSEEQSVGVRSLMSAYESAASRSIEDEPADCDDDTASVRSLRDKFEAPPAEPVENEVKKMRSMFEVKTKTSSKPFEGGAVELQYVFSKFQSKRSANEKASRFKKISGRFQGKDNKVVGEDESEQGFATLDGVPRPDTGHVSVADRARGFAALANANSSPARPKPLKSTSKSAQGMKSTQRTYSLPAQKAGDREQNGENQEQRKHKAVPLFSKPSATNVEIPIERSSRKRADSEESLRLGISRSPLKAYETTEIDFSKSPLLSPPILSIPDIPTTENSLQERQNSSNHDRFTEAAKSVKSSQSSHGPTRPASLRMVAHSSSENRSPPRPSAAPQDAQPAEETDEINKQASGNGSEHDFYVKPITLRPGLKKGASSPKKQYLAPTQSLLGGNGDIVKAKEPFGNHLVQSAPSQGVCLPMSMSEEEAFPGINFPERVQPNQAQSALFGFSPPGNQSFVMDSTLDSVPTANPLIAAHNQTRLSASDDSVPTANPIIATPARQDRKHALPGSPDEHKVLLKNSVSVGRPMKLTKTEGEHSLSPATKGSLSGSDFSDGVTLDVSIADVSGLTMPTALTMKIDEGHSIPDSRFDERSIEQRSSVDEDAHRSQATSQSSLQTPELYAPLIEQTLRASDESTFGESFVAARTLQAEKRKDGLEWDQRVREHSKNDEEKKSDGGQDDSTGLWDTTRVDNVFPTMVSGSHEMFEFENSYSFSPGRPAQPLEPAERKNQLSPPHIDLRSAMSTTADSTQYEENTTTRSEGGTHSVVSSTTPKRKHLVGPASFTRLRGRHENEEMQLLTPKTPTADVRSTLPTQSSGTKTPTRADQRGNSPLEFVSTPSRAYAPGPATFMEVRERGNVQESNIPLAKTTKEIAFQSYLASSTTTPKRSNTSPTSQPEVDNDYVAQVRDLQGYRNKRSMGAKSPAKVTGTVYTTASATGREHLDSLRPLTSTRVGSESHVSVEPRQEPHAKQWGGVNTGIAVTPTRKMNDHLSETKTPTTSNRRFVSDRSPIPSLRRSSSHSINQDNTNVENHSLRGHAPSSSSPTRMHIASSNINREPRMMISPVSTPGSTRESKAIGYPHDIQSIPQPQTAKSNTAASESTDPTSQPPRANSQTVSRIPLIRQRYRQIKREYTPEVSSANDQHTPSSSEQNPAVISPEASPARNKLHQGGNKLNPGNTAILARLKRMKEARLRRAARVYHSHLELEEGGGRE